MRPDEVLAERDAGCTSTGAPCWTLADFGAVILLALPLLVGAGVAAAWLFRLLEGSSAGRPAALIDALSGTAAYVVETGLLLGLLWLRHRTTRRDLGWVRPMPGWLLSAVPIAAGLIIVSGQLALVAHELMPNTVDVQCTSLRHAYGGAPLLAFPVAVVIAPVCEETLFRGFMYGWLRSRMRWSYAVVISAVLFSAAHRSLLLALPLMAAGVVLAYAYERSRSIWPGVLIHALFNLCALAVILSAPGCG